MTEPVYELYRLIFANGKLYFGISEDSEKRFSIHLRRARARRSKLPVHCAIRKHGVPRMERLLVGRRSFICMMEVAAIAEWKTRDRRFGYNITAGGDIAPSKDPRVAAKISAANIKKAADPAYIAKLRAAHSTPEARAAQSAVTKRAWADPAYAEARRAQQRDPESKKAKSASSKAWYAENSHPFLGRRQTEEARAQISTSCRAWFAAHPRAPASAETRAKQSAAKRDLVYMTDGVRTFRIHRRVPLPHGWRYGRTLKKKAA